MTRWPPLLVVAGTAAVLACGNNPPTIPPELLAPTGQTADDYPTGPYGVEIGDTIEDATFVGWPDPAAANHDPQSAGPLSFSSFYNPDEDDGPELLLLNTTAIWCASCRVEHGDLPSRHEVFASRGLIIFALLYQDANANPATLDDLEAWTTQFETNFPMAIDPDFLMGRFVAPEVAPLNLLVDARTMQVLERFIGDQQAVIWPTIDNELDARGR